MKTSTTKIIRSKSQQRIIRRRTLRLKKFLEWVERSELIVQKWSTKYMRIAKRSQMMKMMFK
jgi:hypothetical protein